MKILFITSTYLGDAIIASGLLEVLRQQYPEACFTIAGGRVPLPLFQSMPQVEALIPIDKESYGRHWLKLWMQCITTRWDLVVDGRGTAVSCFLWAKKRLIWQGGQLPILKVHQLSQWMGMDATPPSCIHVSASDEQAAEALIQGRRIICLSPTANWDKKCWPLSSFVALGKCLVATDGLYAGASLAIVGAPSQRASLDSLFEALPSHQTLDWVGKIDLTVLAALLKRVSLFVGNDSGLMHMAAAMGAPTLGLFGPSDDRVYGPWGLRAHAIRTPSSFEESMRQARAGAFPMGELSVDSVLEKLRGLNSHAYCQE